ncbi:MAG: ATP-binding cassette domain-containing protein [Lachnospiraceae bacterium]|nr:ATP-binding cassette domain-containing protein [Lachnospiraceae bacterium]
MASVSVKNIYFSYGAEGGSPEPVLRDVSLDIGEASFTAVTGRTGSGKSTLLQILAGLLAPDSGSVTIGGREIYSAADPGEGGTRRFRKQSQKKAAIPRKEICRLAGMVFQYPEHQLFEASVLADVMFGPLNMGFWKEEAREKAEAALKAVGLDMQYCEKSPFRLSGGEKRRAAIAGVLAMDPEIIIFDEPTAGLDPAGRREIAGIALSLKEQGKGIIWASHYMDEAADLADRVIVMDAGRIAMDGSPAEIFSRTDELRALGLDSPEPVRILSELKKAGIEAGAGVTSDGAAAGILRAWRARHDP